MGRKIRAELVGAALESWVALNERLMELTEDEVVKAIEVEERSKEPRGSIVKRLNQRLFSMRMQEVRKEIET
jgi:hypothetical protein